MLIVTKIGSDRTIDGYVVHGPPQPLSTFQSLAHASRFQARIQESLLTYQERWGSHSASFAGDGRLVFKTIFPDGTPSSVLLDPVWTLVDAERIEKEHNM